MYFTRLVCPEKYWDVCIYVVGVLGTDKANKSSDSKSKCIAE
jgi:hypothetical protein